MPLSRQMDASFCESEEVIHSAWIQMVDKRSDREMQKFKLCMRKQMSILQLQRNGVTVQEKVHFCTNST